MKTNIQKLQEWIDKEKKKGLINIDFTLAPNADKFTAEAMAEEILRMINAQGVPDKYLI